MHKLDRAQATVPPCLANYAYPAQTWDDVSCADKREIRTSLIQMQGERCAYCECALFEDAHIEHFRRKNQNHYPQFTFDWNNLFLSCQSPDHCGHYKDHKGKPYNPNDLIKPDTDDPDKYFYFHSTGQLCVRNPLSTQDQHRATETIRVFHLDDPVLTRNRSRALKQYLRLLDSGTDANDPQQAIVDVLMELDPRSRAEFIHAEIEATRADPHCTVIRHFFEQVH